MNKKIIGILLAFVLVVPIFSAATSAATLSDFSLFKMSDWAREEFLIGQGCGLMTERVLFMDYTAPISREYFCDLIVRCYRKILGSSSLPVVEGFSFTDIESTNIEIAYQLGIVSGVGDGRFAPYEFVTREQVSKMLSIMVRLVNKREAPGTEDILDTLSDSWNISDWARPYVAHMLNGEYMNGVSSTEFAPQSNISIESVVLLVKRIYLKFGTSLPEPIDIKTSLSAPIQPGNFRLEWESSVELDPEDPEDVYTVRLYNAELYISSTSGLRSRRATVLELKTTDKFIDINVDDSMLGFDGYVTVANGSNYAPPMRIIFGG